MSDEVYIVHDRRTEPVYVFGHKEDAQAFAQAVWGELGPVMDGVVIAASVCDHADARRLIESQGD